MDKNTNSGKSEGSSNYYGGNYYGGGYYYGDNYSGQDYGGGGVAVAPTRNLKDYLVIIRERIWWLIVSVFLVFMASVIITFYMTPVYRASSTIQVLRQEEKVTQFENVVDSRVQNIEDFNTQIKILESTTIIDRVAKRIKGRDRKAFLKPYEKPGEDPIGMPEFNQILYDHRSISPLRLTLMVSVFYEHPDKDIAAKVANLFAEEFINYNTNLLVDGSMRAVDDLKVRASQQREEVEKIELELADFKEKHKTVSFDSETDIGQQELLRLNEMVTNDKRVLDEAQTRWNQIEKQKKSGDDLWELNFIASNPQISGLLNTLSNYKIQLASISRKYKSKHPVYVETNNALEETRRELERAVEVAAESFYNDYVQAKENYENSLSRLKQKEAERIELERVKIEYDAMSRRLEVAEDMYNYLYTRMQQAMTQATDDAQTARIVDRAVPPLEPYKPRILLNLAVGGVGGIVLGFGMIFLLSMIDDKIKTAFDIEVTVGIPLVGIVPRISKTDVHEKARVVARGSDKHTLESFRVIHSTLKLNETSRKAKVFLVTSTIPSEGKSFVATNVAFTFSSHGDKTIIIDGDLRMPNVAKSLQLENKQGILQYLDGEVTLEDVIIRDVENGADVLVAGGRTKNPTQLLGSEKFEELMHELRMRYDRIVIDSPPLAPVSDALNILPLVDGVLYVIRFNTVKLKAARINVRRLRDSTVPIFGAILNNINTGVAGYYYSHYDKSYKNYYMSDEDVQEVTS